MARILVLGLSLAVSFAAMILATDSNLPSSPAAGAVEAFKTSLEFNTNFPESNSGTADMPNDNRNVEKAGGETGELYQLEKWKRRRQGKLLKNILIAKIPHVSVGMVPPKAIFTAGIATRNSGGGGGWGGGGGGGGGGGWGRGWGGGGGWGGQVGWGGWGHGGGGGGWGGWGGGGGPGWGGWNQGWGGGGGGGSGWCESKKILRAKAKAKKKIARAKAKAQKKAAKAGIQSGWGPPGGWGGGGGGWGGGGNGGGGWGGWGKGGGGGGGGWRGGNTNIGGGGGHGGGGGGHGGGGGGGHGGGGGGGHGGGIGGGGGGWRSLDGEMENNNHDSPPSHPMHQQQQQQRNSGEMLDPEFKDEVWPNSPPRTARIGLEEPIQVQLEQPQQRSDVQNQFGIIDGQEISASGGTGFFPGAQFMQNAIVGPADPGFRIVTTDDSSVPILWSSGNTNNHVNHNNNNNNNGGQMMHVNLADLVTAQPNSGGGGEGVTGISTPSSNVAMSQAMFLRLVCPTFPSMCMYVRS